MDFEQHIYGMSEEGEAAIIYILRADNGAELRLSNYGASIIGLKIPNKEGRLEEIIDSPANFEAMLRDREYTGRSIDWSVGLRREGIHNTMWESRFETNRVVMSHEVDGVEIEAIFDFDDEISLEVTYMARGEEYSNIDIAPNLLFLLPKDGGHLQINSSELRPLDELCPRRGEVDFVKEGHQNGILAPIALLRGDGNQMEILTSKDGINLYMCGDSVAITPRALTAQTTKGGELYCQKMVYKFSTY
ncbi:MAG: hypothetical protein SNG27_03050 [Rikenellaceae bacterium]